MQHCLRAMSVHEALLKTYPPSRTLVLSDPQRLQDFMSDSSLSIAFKLDVLIKLMYLFKDTTCQGS